MVEKHLRIIKPELIEKMINNTADIVPDMKYNIFEEKLIQYIDDQIKKCNGIDFHYYENLKKRTESIFDIHLLNIGIVEDKEKLENINIFNGFYITINKEILFNGSLDKTPTPVSRIYFKIDDIRTTPELVKKIDNEVSIIFPRIEHHIGIGLDNFEIISLDVVLSTTEEEREILLEG